MIALYTGLGKKKKAALLGFSRSASVMPSERRSLQHAACGMRHANLFGGVEINDGKVLGLVEI